MLRRVHHINFIVRDLADGIERFEAILGAPPERTDELAARGALTATFKLAPFLVVQLWVVPISNRQAVSTKPQFALYNPIIDSLDWMANRL